MSAASRLSSLLTRNSSDLVLRSRGRLAVGVGTQVSALLSAGDGAEVTVDEVAATVISGVVLAGGVATRLGDGVDSST